MYPPVHPADGVYGAAMHQHQPPQWQPVRPRKPPVWRQVPVWAWVVAGAVVLAGLSVAAMLGPKVLQGSTADVSPSPSPTVHMTADQLVQQLGSQGLVRLLDCTVDSPAAPTLTQETCQSVDNGGQIVVMVFADGAGAAEGLARLRSLLGAGGVRGAVVQGPYWLVNLGDAPAFERSDVVKAIGGQVVTIG